MSKSCPQNVNRRSFDRRLTDFAREFSGGREDSADKIRGVLNEKCGTPGNRDKTHAIHSRKPVRLGSILQQLPSFDAKRLSINIGHSISADATLFHWALPTLALTHFAPLARIQWLVASLAGWGDFVSVFIDFRRHFLPDIFRARRMLNLIGGGPWGRTDLRLADAEPVCAPEGYAVMATRSAASSLRKRLIWTLVSASIIALVSVAAIVVYRTTKIGPEGPIAVATSDERSGENVGIKPNSGATASTDRKAEPVASGNANQTSTATISKPAGDFHSSRYGYTVALDGTPWTRWEGLAEIVPDAECGALLNNYGRLLVIPVSLASLDPRPEALDHALLARLGIAYPSDELTDFATVNRDAAVGQAFRLTREVGGVENRYRLQIWRRGGCAYLVAAWMDRTAAADNTAHAAVAVENTGLANVAEIDSQLDKVMDRFSLDGTQVKPPQIDQFTPSQRQTHAAIYNDLGMFASGTHDDAAAVDCFRLAFHLQPNDPAMLTNLVNAHVELKQFREALTELEPNLERFENQPDLWAGRAYLLAELGDTDAALSAYAALFASGYRADVPFTQYVTLLAQNDRLREALATTQQYLKVKESLAIRRLEAALDRKMGNREQAIAVLTQLMHAHPFNAEVAYDLCDTLWDAQRYDDSLEICRQLLEHRYDTAHTYWLQGRCQYALKMYKPARESLEAALKREPAHKEARDLLVVVNAALVDKKIR